MDDRTIEVEHRLDELRQVSALVRAERRAAGHATDGAPPSGIRVALGRRLVAAGTAMQGMQSTARTARN